MLRTTMGFKDVEGSSDTVSTEFNYLQPTVKRIDIISQKNEPGSNKPIHVLQQNVKMSDNAKRDSSIATNRPARLNLDES